MDGRVIAIDCTSVLSALHLEKYISEWVNKCLF